MDDFSKMKKYEGPQKPQAFSHMLWFFIVPAIGFMAWASWTLLGSLSEKPQQSSLVERVVEIRTAKSSGARYQSAYTFAQELQKSIRSSSSPLSETDKDLLFSELGSLLEEFPDDARLRRYLILTLAQMKDPRNIPLFEKSVEDKDSDIRFYSAWGLIELLSAFPEKATSQHKELFISWLAGEDPAYKKIAASYLVKFPEDRPKVVALLSDKNKEVQWNAAVALASQKDGAGRKHIEEMLQLHTLRAISFRSSQDLQQFVATALEAVKNLGDSELVRVAAALKEKVVKSNPEGKAIHAAFSGFSFEPKVNSEK